MSKNWRIILLVILGGAFLVGLVSTIVPKLQKSSKDASSGAPSSSTQQKSPTVDTSQWETFHSDQFGYSVKHPKGWIVDDSEFAAKQVIRITEGNNASVKVNAFYDKAMTSIEKVKEGMKFFEEKMRADKNLTVGQFQTSVEGQVGGYIAQGTQIIDGNSYIFENRGILSTNGRVLIFHGVAKEALAKDYRDILIAIIKSFALDKNK